jgi:hypothetical protein
VEGREGASSFPFNCHNYGIRGHKRSNCRKPGQYSGNYNQGHQVEINVMAGTTMEVVTWDSVSMEVTKTEINPNKMEESRRKCSVYRKGLE